VPGRPAQTPQNGNGALARGRLEAARAAEYGLDTDGSGYGWPPAKNRFQETSALLARLHRYELSLRKHWWILALALAVSLGPAAWHVRHTPLSYQSTGKLWMSGKLDLKEGQLYSEELGNFIGTQVELLKSSTIYERALANLLVAHPGQSPLTTNDLSADPRPFKVTVTDFPKAAVIEIRAVGKNREAVREFVDSLMEEYQLFRKGVRNQTSDVTLSSIREDVKRLEQEVKTRQGLLQDFLASNNIVLLQEQGSSAGAYAGRLSKQLASLRTELRLLQLITPEELAQTASKSPVLSADEPSPVEATAGELMNTLAGPQADFFRASQQIQLLKAKREELLEFLLPTHPKILKYDDDIAEQEKIVEVFKREGLTQMASRRQALGARIKSLQTETADWEAKALDASRKMADYDRLRQDVQRSQALYEKLLGVIQQVDVNRTLDQENVRVMDAASDPTPVRGTIVFLVFGLAAGLALGLGLLYFVNRFDDRFASLTELTEQIPETVIGQVPQIHVSKRHPALDLSGADLSHHAFAEAFRNIRSWVLFSCEKSKQPKMLLVASSVPVEGKSTVASNLALALALAGARVLLVDADLRRTGLHILFGLPGDTGLADVLEQRAAYENLIQPTKAANLWLLPAGSATLNPGELFLAPSCDLFLARIRTQYDYVILDSAPLLAADDTANLAPKVDAVLYLVRANFTSARHAREGLNQLRQRKAHILGLIFNRSTGTRASGYHYGYKDYYHYGRNGRSGEPPGKAHAVAKGEPTAEPS